MKQGKKNYISVIETSDLLGVSVQWVRALITQGTFVDVLRGKQRSYWISEDEVRTKRASIPGRDRLIRKEA